MLARATRLENLSTCGSVSTSYSLLLLLFMLLLFLLYGCIYVVYMLFSYKYKRLVLRNYPDNEYKMLREFLLSPRTRWREQEVEVKREKMPRVE